MARKMLRPRGIRGFVRRRLCAKSPGLAAQSPAKATRAAGRWSWSTVGRASLLLVSRRHLRPSPQSWCLRTCFVAAHDPDGAERPRDQGQSPKWPQKRRARSTVSLFMVNLGFAHLSGHDGNHIHAFWHGQFTAHRLAGLGAQARLPQLPALARTVSGCKTPSGLLASDLLNTRFKSAQAS